MVVVGPFREMVGKLATRQVRTCIFKIDYYQLLMLVGWPKKGRLLVVWPNAKDITILCLW